VEVVAARLRQVGDARQRRPKVTFDVDGQGLERGDVQRAASAFLWGLWLEHQAVEAPQEGRERLARAGWREDQRGIAARDDRPTLPLGTRGPLERRSEPVGDRRMKGRGQRLQLYPRRAGCGTV